MTQIHVLFVSFCIHKLTFQTSPTSVIRGKHAVSEVSKETSKPAEQFWGLTPREGGAPSLKEVAR